MIANTVRNKCFVTYDFRFFATQIVLGQGLRGSPVTSLPPIVMVGCTDSPNAWHNATQGTPQLSQAPADTEREMDPLRGHTVNFSHFLLPCYRCQS